MRYITKPIYAGLGFDEEPNATHVQLMHQALIVQHACFFGNVYCINKAQLIYRDWMGDKKNNL